jgi:predicted metalloenzyme YecM
MMDGKQNVKYRFFTRILRYFSTTDERMINGRIIIIIIIIKPLLLSQIFLI